MSWFTIFVVRVLRMMGASAMLLAGNGLTAKQLRAAGFTPQELVAGGLPVAELRAAGFTAQELKSHVTLWELREGGFTVREMINLFFIRELREAGYTVRDFRTVYPEDYRLAYALLSNGYSIPDLLADGVPADKISEAMRFIAGS